MGAGYDMEPGSSSPVPSLMASSIFTLSVLGLFTMLVGGWEGEVSSKFPPPIADSAPRSGDR